MRQTFFLFFVTLFLTMNCNIMIGQTQQGERVAKENLPIGEGYTYTVVPSINKTWCYDIYKGEKLLIHQKSKPGITGNEGFKTKSDAEKVARLVVEKLQKGEMPPSVTKEEMENLKVL